MQRIDTEKLLNDNPIEEIIRRYAKLKKNGPHMKCTCPFHDDHHASLTITPKKNLAKCFACGWSGDAIAFVMDFTKKSFKDACEEIDSKSVSKLVSNPVSKSPSKKPEKEWTQVTPPNEPLGEITHFKHGSPSAFWVYHLDNGHLLGYVLRFDTPDGKEVLPYTYCTDGAGNFQWRFQGFGTPRPMYNLHLIAANLNATILLVEGEKSADAAQKELDPARVVVSTWPGGSMSIAHVDWVPLYGRKVLLWPDNDVQGISAMLHVRHIVGKELALCKIVPPDTTLPKGWDCADKEWQPGELRDFVLSRLVDDIPANHGESMWKMAQIDRTSVYEFGIDYDRWVFRELKRTEPEPPPPLPMLEELEERNEAPIETQDYIGYTRHFKFLGWDKFEGAMRHHFFQLEAKATIGMSASSISKSALISIAPLRFWETYFPGSKASINIDAAQEFLIRTSIAQGPFNEKYVRGRGAWMDNGRVIIHTGSELIVDGKTVSLGSIKSRYVYETSDHLGVVSIDPLNTKQANRLIDILSLLNWEREVNTFLLAGWSIIAPFCGALRWRPHIWLTGSAGTGKSWVFTNIIRRLLGETALAVQGETTEAGLRQTLNHDALPVVFDEAEAEDKRSGDRIQNILSLMRSASTDDGGLLLKGSAGGVAKSFSIRSCFAFASIGIQAAQQSDRSRITILSMKALPSESPIKTQRWQDLQRLYNEVMTDEFVYRLQARTVSLLPIIIKNSITFANAAAAHLGEQRQGDQLGPIIAGAYSLFSDKEVTYDKALEWIATKDWTEEQNLDQSKDERSLLAFIMDSMTRVEGEHTTVERQIGELVQIAAADNMMFSVGTELTNANNRLKRLGIRVENKEIMISNSSDQIRKILKETAWAKNHHRLLLRLPGAYEKQCVRFASGITTRAVAIPLSILD